jgi:hypothetical protein
MATSVDTERMCDLKESWLLLPRKTSAFRFNFPDAFFFLVFTGDPSFDICSVPGPTPGKKRNVVFVQVCAFTQQELLPLGNINPGFNYIRLTRDGCPNTLLGCNQVCKGPTHYSPAVVIDRFCALAGALARDFPTRMASILRDDYDTTFDNPPPNALLVTTYRLSILPDEDEGSESETDCDGISEDVPIGDDGKGAVSTSGAWSELATSSDWSSDAVSDSGFDEQGSDDPSEEEEDQEDQPSETSAATAAGDDGRCGRLSGLRGQPTDTQPLVSSGEPRGPKRSFVGGPASLRTSPPCKRRKVGTLRPQADRPDARRQ